MDAASTQSFRALSPQERTHALLLTLGVALLFTSGFIPTAHSFFHLIWNTLGLGNNNWKSFLEMAAFPGLAALFYFSMPLPKAIAQEDTRSLLRTAPIPILLSFGLGLCLSNPTVFQTGIGEEFFWYVLLVPVGEELLFRGWLYNVIEKWWPKRRFTFTNPLPTAIWSSSLAFALWHLQNLGTMSVTHVLFQTAYTLFAGLWLGYLRWKSGGLALPIAMHSALNVATMLV